MASSSSNGSLNPPEEEEVSETKSSLWEESPLLPDQFLIATEPGTNFIDGGDTQPSKRMSRSRSTKHPAEAHDAMGVVEDGEGEREQTEEEIEEETYLGAVSLTGLACRYFGRLVRDLITFVIRGGLGAMTFFMDQVLMAFVTLTEFIPGWSRSSLSSCSFLLLFLFVFYVMVCFFYSSSPSFFFF